MHQEMKPHIANPVRVFRTMPRFHASMALLLMAVCPALPAQAAGKDGKSAVSIYCPGYAAGLKSVFVKSGKNSYEAVGLSTANIVEAPEALVENGRLLLYGPAGDGGKHPVVADAEIGGLRQPLVVLHPAGGDAGPAYASKAVEADPKEFPLGAFMLVNLSPNPVRISHGGKIIEIENGGSRLFKPDVPAGEALAVTMDYKNGENWALFSSARWATRNDRRTLVCFQLDSASKRMTAKSVPLRGDSGR